jgi:hypothetical protein
VGESRTHIEAAQKPEVLVEIPYSSRSRFFAPIESALAGGVDLSRPVHVELGSGGYDGEFVVMIRHGDRHTFATDWTGADVSRMPVRVRAAATVLMNRGYHGPFVITHRGGLLTVRRAGLSETRTEEVSAILTAPPAPGLRRQETPPSVGAATVRHNSVRLTETTDRPFPPITPTTEEL